jgi:hypothetical protein
MSSEIVSLALKDVAGSVLGVTLSKGLDLSSKFNFGDSLVMRNASNGLIYFAVSDGLDYLLGDGSKLLSQNFLGVLDDVVYFGSTSALAELTKVDAEAYKIANRTLKLSRDMSDTLVQSAIVSGTRFLGNYIDSRPEVPNAVKMFRHPVSAMSNPNRQ